MTAVIYARYSSDNQREESIEGQIRECTAYAEKNGITVIKHYIDRALSAKTDNRPEFQQMIKDSEKRLFDIVLVWKLDRFARNRYDSAHYEYQLERNHVKLVSATEPISEGPAGIMVKSMLTGMAEYYSAELSEKVVRGMTENVLKGKYNGGTIPIGYTVDEEKFFQIDPLKAPFVVEAFQRYNDGATMKELMNWLNDSGVTTNRNQKFTYNSIQTLLTNRRYIGENRFKDIVMPDSIPVIIEKELFDSVQDKIAKNRRAPARHKAEDDYLLTTKLFCGMCGAMMFGECGTSRNKNVHHYYKCANAKRTKTCKKKTVRKEWLEDLVVCETMKMIHDDDCIQSIVDAVMILQEQENTVLPLLEKQMKDIENGIENLLNAIQAGVLTSSTKGRLEKLEAQQKELEIRIAEEKLAKPKVSADFVKFWLTNFRKLDPNVKSHRETLINTFVNAVYLYDEKVLITFNYKDGTKTITFDEIAAKDAPEGNGSDLGCFAPAGQSTQMIVGASPETDYHILQLTEGLYNKYHLKRVFYSAYIPVTEDTRLPALDTKPPLLREHRLYQADWLLRFYEFKAEELLDRDNPNFNPYLDPKCNWAVQHYGLFPVDVNRAPFEMLLRVPGIGPKSARRIWHARKQAALGLDELKRMGVVLKRAQYFITCRGFAGAHPGRGSAGRERITRALIDPNVFSGGVEQLSMFSPPAVDRLVEQGVPPRTAQKMVREEAVQCLARAL